MLEGFIEEHTFVDLILNNISKIECSIEDSEEISNIKLIEKQKRELDQAEKDSIKEKNKLNEEIKKKEEEESKRLEQQKHKEKTIKSLK